MPSERGQGTIEWIGLVLLVALALGALAKSVRSATAAPELGEALAERITATAAGAAAAVPPVRRPRVVPPHVVPLRAPLPARPRPGALEMAVLPGLAMLRSRAPVGGVRFPRMRIPHPRMAGSPFGDFLRLVGGAADEGISRAWLGCLAYRRFRYALNQGHTSIRPMPLEEGLDAFNECLNPFEFLGED